MRESFHEDDDHRFYVDMMMMMRHVHYYYLHDDDDSSEMLSLEWCDLDGWGLIAHDVGGSGWLVIKLLLLLLMLSQVGPGVTYYRAPFLATLRTVVNLVQPLMLDCDVELRMVVVNLVVIYPTRCCHDADHVVDGDDDDQQCSRHQIT